jgi:transposase
MKFVNQLSEAELITLREMHAHHPAHRVRMRAQALLLSHKGCQIDEITFILEVARQTVSSWIDAWEKEGLRSLYDTLRAGRPPCLSKDDVQYVKDLIQEEPRSINRVAALLEENRGKRVSQSTIRRILKKAKLRWKRVRKSLKLKRNEDKFLKMQEKISVLEQRRADGEVDLYYFDESGFCLDPSIPYAWQAPKEVIELPASKGGKRLNVLAFMNKDNELHPFTVQGTVSSATVIACFNEFSKTLDKKTFVIMDNSSVHRSHAFIENLPQWSKQGLFIKFLPTYSPELNSIEILWRKIKYDWLPFSAYLSFGKLQEAVEHILKGFSSEYTINFTT